MTHFMHLRYKTPVETLAGYFNEVDARGGLTVAYELDIENSALKVAYAKCSKRDLFNKKRGRQIAEGRLKSDKHCYKVKFADAEEFNSISLDRKVAQEYALGAIVAMLPEEAQLDLAELLSPTRSE